MIRGIERRKIFNDDTDRENFIERLSALLPETQCCAWSFLSNHAHFLLRSGPAGIAALMRRLLTERDRVTARDLLCYWTVVELGIPMVDLARKFDLTPAAVSCAVQRSEKMAKEKDYQLETGDI